MVSRKSIFKNLAIDIPTTSEPRIVIIGGGFGGIQLAKKIVKHPFQVVLIDRNNYHTFQPLLYQVATAGLEPDSIAGPLRPLMKNHKNFYFRMLRVTQINPEKKTISTIIGDLKYDILVIANGAKTNFYNNRNIASQAFPLKQLPQALDLRSHILQNFEQAVMIQDPAEKESLLNIVIVGGGPTGVELAGALSELRKHVLPNDYHELDFRKMGIYLIEGHSRLLQSMSEASGRNAYKYLSRFGVQIHLDTIVKDYSGEKVFLSSGEIIGSKTLIWAAGVEGNLIRGLPEEIIRNGRISVNRYNQVGDYNDMYAIGDVAFMQLEDHPDGLPMLAPVAMQQGVHLAENLIRASRQKSLIPFSFKNKGTMATVGRNKAVVDLPGNFQLGGLLAWMTWMFVHLVSLIGFRNKLVVFNNWLWNYITYDRGTRLIIRLFIPDEKTRKNIH